jgi:hypothetical protein
MGRLAEKCGSIRRDPGPRQVGENGSHTTAARRDLRRKRLDSLREMLSAVERGLDLAAPIVVERLHDEGVRSHGILLEDVSPADPASRHHPGKPHALTP